MQHPVITNMELTGDPYCRQQEKYRCPVCNARCEEVYYSTEQHQLVGCPRCTMRIDANIYFKEENN